jgi:hypothetical protein
MSVLSMVAVAVLGVRERLRDTEGYVMPVTSTHAALGPNVVLVVLDSTRRDAVSPYGAVDEEVTPNIARLAEHGVVFDAAYSAASFSGPAYASLLTGRYPPAHGVLDHPAVLAGDNRTLLEAAASAGYYTLHVTEHSFLRDNWNFDQGASLYRFSENPDALSDLVEWWIETHPKVPFVAVIVFMGAHYPYGLEDDRQELWGGLSERDRHLHQNTDTHGRQYAYAATGLSDAYAAAQWLSYLAEVQRADRRLGRIVDALERSGLAEETVVIVTADHGEAFGEHGFYFCHDPVVYGPVSRVPLIVSWPGRLPAIRVTSAVSLVDLVPTVAEWIGDEVGGEVDGVSWMRAIRGEETSDKRPVFCFSRPFGEGARDRFPLIAELTGRPGYAGSAFLGAVGRWDLVLRPLQQGFAAELFDRVNDPLHRVDVWPEHATEPEVARLNSLVRAYRDQLLAAAGSATEPLSDRQRDELRRLGYIE